MTPPPQNATESKATKRSEDSEAEDRFTLELEQLDDYQFHVRFDLEGVDDLLVDETEPVGDGRGPNPSRLVAAGVANCLSASLLFCLRKSKVENARIDATATGELVRDERERLRLGRFDVQIRLRGIGEDQRGKLDRCLDLFEDYCVVTQSIRDGIPVDVAVEVVDADDEE